jgi:hypothetical protein
MNGYASRRPASAYLSISTEDRARGGRDSSTFFQDRFQRKIVLFWQKTSVHYKQDCESLQYIWEPNRRLSRTPKKKRQSD